MAPAGEIYNFARIPAKAKDATIQRLAVLNLERNRCIEAIDELFREEVLTAQKRERRPSQAAKSGHPTASRRARK